MGSGNRGTMGMEDMATNFACPADGAGAKVPALGREAQELGVG